MPVVASSGFDQLSARAALSAGNGGGVEPPVIDAVAGLDRVGAALQATRAVQPLKLTFPPSQEERGLALKTLTLTRGFEGLIGNLFKPQNEIFFLAWGYDLGGEPPWLWPGTDFDPETLLSRLKAGESRTFLGSGAPLFPQRQVNGGLVIRIQIWESDADVRRFGKTLEDVSKAIDDSKLTNALTLISTVGARRRRRWR